MMANGEDCECGAVCEYECSCTVVDWRSRREADLEAEVSELSDVIRTQTANNVTLRAEVERLKKELAPYREAERQQQEAVKVRQERQLLGLCPRCGSDEGGSCQCYSR